MNIQRLFVGTGLLMLLFCCTQAAALQHHIPLLIATVGHTPRVLRINGKNATYYEVRLQNMSTAVLSLRKLLITAGKSRRKILTLSGNSLLARLSNHASGLLSPNQTVFIFVELTLSSVEGPGLVLNHEIDYNFQNTDYKSFLKINLAARQPIVLDAPLGAGNWAAIYNADWERGHRRVFFTIDNTIRLPGRYAIDFIKLDNQGQQSTGDEDAIKNWHGYNEAVMAVADAKVITVVDSVKESATISGQAPVDSSKAAGNYVVLKLKDHVFVIYEHLKPGSIRVKAGDFVKKGQIIASLGFTGQSTGPHLHFHLADSETPLGGEGIPYVFRNFYYKGFYKNFDNFSKTKWIDVPTTRSARSREFPPSNTVISFKQVGSSGK